jgi:4a-hydroxytetrahydrobiopterin dehydratase
MINWEEKEGRLYRQFVFQDFVSAWAFMSAVALIAEKMDHHPNWSNVYNNVDIYLCTHDAGNQITEKDHRLAKAIDQIVKRFSMSL